MPRASDANTTNKRKPYKKPAARQLSAEQARIILREHANKGHQGARELLELISPGSRDSKEVGEEVSDGGTRKPGARKSAAQRH